MGRWLLEGHAGGELAVDRTGEVDTMVCSIHSMPFIHCGLPTYWSDPGL